ncbi:type IV secretion system protein VirB2 [Novosphingobium panipatense]|jgi:type IV secretion system protein VirB2|uniref:Type IV secretion system protein VirB2 n=1 Tax=Novosphingobium panipatense TaxID=428991 RepID=A0ABY1PZU4_9SPHN|nr:type IV secretion system protein VirB2 [Novosphingobium panipatense]
MTILPPHRHIRVIQFVHFGPRTEGTVIRYAHLRNRFTGGFLPAAAAAMATLFPSLAMAQAVATDPAGSGPIVAALGWLQGTLLGNVATAVAVMAVAAVGFMMLTGRMNWRFGATVIIGVFILFGAGAIVTGIQSAAMG